MEKTRCSTRTTQSHDFDFSCPQTNDVYLSSPSRRRRRQPAVRTGGTVCPRNPLEAKAPQVPLEYCGILGSLRQHHLPATAGADSYPPAFPARCVSSRGTSSPVAASGSAAAFTWVTWEDHQCWRLASPSGSSTLPVRVQLARGSSAGASRALRSSSSPSSVAKGMTSCRSQPSSASARETAEAPPAAPPGPLPTHWPRRSRPRIFPG